MSLAKRNPGRSLTVVVGSYGGFHILIQNGSFRICLGWIALTYYPFDMEGVLQECMHKDEKLQAFAEWAGQHYIKLHGCWIHRFADQRDPDNYMETEELLHLWITKQQNLHRELAKHNPTKEESKCKA